MSTNSIWFQILRQYLDKSMKKYFHEIIANLQATNLSIKPGFIWDYGGFDIKIQQIENVLKTLKKSDKLCRSIYMINISDSLIIINLECCLKIIHVSKNNSLKFVNISKSLEEAEIIKDGSILENINQMLDTLQNLLTNNIEITLNITPLVDWCVPTIFGLLLGFPFIYYMDNESDISGLNCLSMVPLTVFKAKFKTSNLFHNIFSFSLPTNLVDSFENKFDEWKNNTNFRFKQQNYFQEIKFESNQICLPTLVL